MGPKLVNTVVGIHNNEFLKFVSELQQKAQTTENRLRKIEEKLNIKPESPVSKYNRNRKGL